jgi:pilus assembly protein CpaE
MMTSSPTDPIADQSSVPASEPQPAAIRVSVAVVEAHVPTRERMVSLLSDGVTPFASIEELTARLTGTVPVVVVLGPSCATEDTLAIAERVMVQYPMLATILVVEELTTTMLQQALRAGVRDVLALSGESGALAQAVQRLAVTLDQAPRASNAVMVASSAPAHTEAPAEQGREPEPLETVNGKVLTVFSTKGGAGKSVVASNLGVSLAMRTDKPVVLVDADLQFGDIAVMLKLAPQHTIVDAVSSMDRLDAGLVQNLLATHPPSGLKILPAPLEPAYADQISADDVTNIVDILRTFCAYVVIDTPSYFDDKVLNLIEMSDDVLLVAGMDIPNIKNVKIGLQTMRLLNTPMSKIHLVLNRANSKVKLDVSEVERTLQVKAEVLVPSDVVVPQSVNKGTPVVLDAPKAGVSRALEQLADLFVPANEKGRRKK